MHVCSSSYQRPRAAPMSANYSTSRIITARKSGRLKNSSRPLMDLRKVDRVKALGTWVTYRERENADQRDAEIITIISDIDRGAHDTWWGSGQVLNSREFNRNCSWAKLGWIAKCEMSETAFLSFLINYIWFSDGKIFVWLWRYYFFVSLTSRQFTIRTLAFRRLFIKIYVPDDIFFSSLYSMLVY